MIAVDRDVQREVHAGTVGYLTNSIVDGVTDGHTPSCFRVPNHFGVVQPHNRVESREAGRDHLGAAGESGEEVRFDETDCDSEVGVQPMAIEIYGYPVPGFTCLLQNGTIKGVVVEDSVAIHNSVAEHLSQFRVCVRAVCAGGNQNSDVRVGKVG